MLRIVFPYLTSYGTSLLGNSVTAIALPLLVLLTTGSPLGAGAVAFAAAVPSAIAGILMGSLVDRINRRTAAILADVLSALALALLPIIDLTIGLSLGWFIAIAVLNSFGDVPGITAREAMLPALARAGGIDVSRLIGLRESVGGIAMLLGPAAAGLLVASLNTVSVMWVTAGIATTAALTTLLLPASAAAHDRFTHDGIEAPEGSRASAKRTLHGLELIACTPLLRALVLLMLSLAVVLAALQGMVIPVHFAFQGKEGSVGFALSALAAGMLVGGGIFAAAGNRLPRRVWLIAGIGIIAMGLVVLATLDSTAVVFTGAAIMGLGSGSMNSAVGLAFVEAVDEGRRGTVLGAQNAIMTLVPAAGIGVASVLIEAGSLAFTAAVLAVLWLLAGVAALANPRLRRLGME